MLSTLDSDFALVSDTNVPLPVSHERYPSRSLSEYAENERWRALLSGQVDAAANMDGGFAAFSGL